MFPAFYISDALCQIIHATHTERDGPCQDTKTLEQAGCQLEKDQSLF